MKQQRKGQKQSKVGVGRENEKKIKLFKIAKQSLPQWFQTFPEEINGYTYRSC